MKILKKITNKILFENLCNKLSKIKNFKESATIIEVKIDDFLKVSNENYLISFLYKEPSWKKEVCLNEFNDFFIVGEKDLVPSSIEEKIMNYIIENREKIKKSVISALNDYMKEKYGWES